MLKRLEHDPITNSTVVLILFVLALTFFGGGYYLTDRALKPVARALETTVVTLPDKSSSKARRERRTIKTTWAKKLNSKGAVLYAQCRMDTTCNAGLMVKPFPTAGLLVMLLGASTLGSGIGLSLYLRRKRDTLDDAKWLKVDPWKYPEISRYTEGEKDSAGNVTDPVIVPLGYVVEQAPMPDNAAPERPLMYKYHGMKPIGLTSKMLQEHVLVYGPTGTGKTSRALMHFVLAFARRGDAVVILDFKFPKLNGGFMQTIALFRRFGLPTYPVLPFTRGGFNVPVFDYIQTVQDGRDLAAILVPTPEYKESGGDFYKLTQQIILGAVFKVVAGSVTPNFKEVSRIMNQTQPAFENWLNGTGDAVAIEQLSRFMAEKRDWNGFVTGIINALEAFEDDRVSETFTSVPGRNFDPEKFVKDGGLVYWGIPSDKMRTPRGEVITRVFDNWLTNQIVRLRNEVSRTGPQRSVRLVYDEAPSIGKLRNVLRSVGTLRDSDICLIFGIQNEDQMEITYDEKIWAAITKNLATRLIFPTGFQDDAARTLSGYLGEREIRVRNNSISGTTSLNPEPGSVRRGRTYTVQKRPLATPSEISEWPYFLAILQTKGTLPPALLATVPFHEPRPSFFGLDGRQFVVNNQALHDDWYNIMEHLSDEERQAEIDEYIAETLNGEDQMPAGTLTLKDVFNDWIRFAIVDGATFRRSGKFFEFRYPSLHLSLKDHTAQRAVRAFLMSSWIEPGRGIEDSPEDWDWVRITELGAAVLGTYAKKELENIRFASAYIAERKRLEEAAPDLGARYEEAREVLPVEAAENATMDMLRRFDGLLTKAELAAVTEKIMAKFTPVPGQPELVSIPLSLPFEVLVPRLISQVRGRDESQELTWDDRLGEPDPRPDQTVPAAPAPAEAEPQESDPQDAPVAVAPTAPASPAPVTPALPVTPSPAPDAPAPAVQAFGSPPARPGQATSSQGGADITVPDDADETDVPFLVTPAPVSAGRGKGLSNLRPGGRKPVSEPEPVSPSATEPPLDATPDTSPDTSQVETQMNFAD